MKQYPVIFLKSESKSFSWNDGLFFIVHETIDGLYHLVKLNREGRPHLTDSGDYEVTITGVKNKGIAKTNLIFKSEK